MLLDEFTWLEDAAEKAKKVNEDRYFDFIRAEFKKIPIVVSPGEAVVKEAVEIKKPKPRGRRPKVKKDGEPEVPKTEKPRKKRKGSEFVSLDGFQLEFEKRMDAIASTFDGDRLKLYAQAFPKIPRPGFDEEDDPTRLGNMFRRWLRGQLEWSKCKKYYERMVNWASVESIIMASPLASGIKEEQNLAKSWELHPQV